MDQRREPRFAANQSVAVTVLCEPARHEVAVIKNASGRGLAIEFTEPIEPGTALKIELEDSMILGEAVYCSGQAGRHLVGVELDQVLCGLSQLGRKLQQAFEPRIVTKAVDERLAPQNTPIS
jgi:hypothetical protein